MIHARVTMFLLASMVLADGRFGASAATRV